MVGYRFLRKSERSTSVEFVSNGQQENELESIDETDNDGEENEQNGLFR
jgi:hypothetical protein